MFVQVVSVWAVLFLSMQQGAYAELKFENNAYSNVLVTFSPNVPSEKGQFLLESLQELLENTSQVLQGAFEVRIAEVIFVLPQAWDTTSWGLTLETVSGEETASDIVVDETSDWAFGKHPFTLQFGGCGVSGKHITVPTSFLSSSIDFPKGTLLAREWMKYRYGVFDENGYSGDEMYPDQYFIPGNDEEIKVTECTDPPVEYIYRDPDGNNCTSGSENTDCKIYPGEISAENVTSSFMYFNPDLPNMVHFCGMSHLHNKLSPSKQNILCAEKDIWSVVKTSEDLRSAGEGTVEYSNVVFRFKQQNKPRVSVLWENTEALHGQKTSLVFAVKRFLYDLPEGSQASLYSFNSAEAMERPLSPLSSLDEREISISSPFEADKVGVCPTCALDKAVAELIDAGTEEPGFIILIVGSSNNAAETRNNEIIEKLKNSNLCLTVIALKEMESVIEGYESILFASDCNTMETIEIPPQDGDVTTFDEMYQLMTIGIPQIPADYMTSMVTSGTISFDSVLQIPAEVLADKFTIWLEKDTEVDTIVCTTDDGTVVPLSKVAKRIAYSFSSENKEIACTLKKQIFEPRMAQVVMTTVPGQYFEEEIWINDPTQADEQMPITIYAKINFAHNPVSNAKVIANVTDPDGNMIGEPLVLYDNGKGDPDITKDDGIYSRYFFQFSKAGDYTVTVSIDDDNEMAFVLKNGGDHCCGSQVKALNKEKVPPFKKVLEKSFNVKSGPPENGYPPMRIIDLKVDEFHPPASMVLKWTAPGGEVDMGKASSYEFRLFCDSEEICKDDGSLPQWIAFNNTKPIPKEQGETETAQFLFTDGAPENITFLIGIETIHLNHTSGLSNRIQVQLPSLDEIIEVSTVGPDKVKQEKKYNSNGTLIGSVIAGVFLLICLVGLVYFLITRKKGTKETTNGEFKPTFEDGNGVEKSNSFRAVGHIRTDRNSMRRVESFPVLLYTHDQIKDFREKKDKDPPLFKAAAAAKPWLSLGELPSSSAKPDNDRSQDSVSTVRVNDKISSNEIKQLDDISLSSDMQTDKIAKF